MYIRTQEDFSRLCTVKREIVVGRLFPDVFQFMVASICVAGWHDKIRVVSKINYSTFAVEWLQIGCCDEERSWT